MQFNKLHYNEIWITLSSNEELGILDSDYLEDYFGADGQITLINESTLVRTPLLMNEITGGGPFPHDVFTGYVPSDDLPVGFYHVEARVRDVIGNYSIIGEVSDPIGGERIINLAFEVVEFASAAGVIVQIGAMRLMGIVSMDSSILTPPSLVVSEETHRLIGINMSVQSKVAL